MPFIRRDRNGNIDALYAHDETGNGEWLPAHHPAILGFLDGGADTGFAVLDTELIRVIEDLTDTLISKGLLRLTDLPHSAQTKLLARKGYRDQVGGEPNDILGDTGLI